MEDHDTDPFHEIEKDWYCTAKHLHSLLEDAKYERLANIGRPCSDCKYNIGGLNCDMHFAYLRFQRLGNVTGIVFDSQKKNRQ